MRHYCVCTYFPTPLLGSWLHDTVITGKDPATVLYDFTGIVGRPRMRPRMHQHANTIRRLRVPLYAHKSVYLYNLNLHW